MIEVLLSESADLVFT